MKMRVLSIIFGILMVICGVAFLCQPISDIVKETIGLQYLIVIMSAVYGIIGIIYGIARRRFGVGFVFSILSVIFGILVAVFPMFLVNFDIIMCYMAVCWIIVLGVVSIVTSIRVSRLTSSKKWIWGLILGILSVAVGIYCLFNPAVFGVTITTMVGWFIGVYFIMTGFAMIFISPGPDF